MPSDLDELTVDGYRTRVVDGWKTTRRSYSCPITNSNGQSNLLRQVQMLMAGRQSNPIVNPLAPTVVPPNTSTYKPIWPQV